MNSCKSYCTPAYLPPYPSLYHVSPRTLLLIRSIPLILIVLDDTWGSTYIVNRGHSGVPGYDIGDCRDFGSQEAIEEECNALSICQGYSQNLLASLEEGAKFEGCMKVLGDVGAVSGDWIWYQKPQGSNMYHNLGLPCSLCSSLL